MVQACGTLRYALASPALAAFYSLLQGSAPIEFMVPAFVCSTLAGTGAFFLADLLPIEPLLQFQHFSLIFEVPLLPIQFCCLS